MKGLSRDDLSAAADLIADLAAIDAVVQSVRINDFPWPSIDVHFSTRTAFETACNARGLTWTDKSMNDGLARCMEASTPVTPGVVPQELRIHYEVWSAVDHADWIPKQRTESA